MESSARLGGRVEQGGFALEAVGLALRTSGRDPYGSGSAPAGAPPGSPRPGNDPEFAFDILYVQYASGVDPAFKLTLGRQPIALGSQFLFGDGVYDGYHPDHPQAVYHNPRRSFDAVRLETDTALGHLDAFAYRMHPTWDGGGEWNGWLGGAELSRQTAGGIDLAAGLFRRESHSALDNDMWIVSLRGAAPLPFGAGWSVSGEWAGEFGAGRNPYYVTTQGQDLSEYAWHAELAWRGKNARFQPFAEVGYVYNSKDFTPFAQGFSDWGKWYLGNQIDWIQFGTNSRIVRAEAGFWPREQVKLRVQYHNTRLVSGPGGPLANEWSLIAEWFPSERVWCSALLGYSDPGGALARSGLTNPFGYLNSGAAPVGGETSVDLVFAVGLSY